MIPELFTVTVFIKFGNADSISISRHMLGHNVHGHLGQIHVGPDAGSSRDPGLSQNASDYRHGHLVS